MLPRSGWFLRLALGACLFGLAALTPAHGSEAEGGLRPELEAFIAGMVAKHGFDADELARIFGRARYSSAVIRAISAPSSALPWDEYRRVFVNDRRIRDGVKFWDAHAETLARARQVYGVPEQIIAGVIGVETLYGTRNGSFRVIDALTTLAFDYPQRAEFFRQELEEYLLLARELPLDAAQIKGSYAGAIGIPQFMPSSYRRHAVDFDGDGRSDLMRSAADAIGSVANYLKAYGWEADGPVAGPARVEGETFRSFVNGDIALRHTIDELKQAGITPVEPVAAGRRAALVTLEGAGGSEHWLAYNNFYVLTRYNRSTLYALAVLQLAHEIQAARQSGR